METLKTEDQHKINQKQKQANIIRKLTKVLSTGGIMNPGKVLSKPKIMTYDQKINENNSSDLSEESIESQRADRKRITISEFSGGSTEELELENQRLKAEIERVKSQH